MSIRLPRPLSVALRVAACLAIGVASLYAARWFGLRAAQPLPPQRFDVRPAPGADDAARLSQLVNELRGVETASRPAARSSPAEALMSLLGPAAASQHSDEPLDVPLPAGLTRLYGQTGGGAARSMLAVYRTAASMAGVSAHFEQAMPASGWTAQRGGRSDERRWVGRFSRAGRTCWLMCLPGRRAGETLLVVETVEETSETP